MLLFGGEANHISIPTGGGSGQAAHPIIVQLTLDGHFVRADNILREQNLCDAQISDHTHVEQIIQSEGRSHVVGSTCDYKTVITDANGNHSTCVNCVGKKGDLITWSFECQADLFSAREMQIELVASYDRQEPPSGPLIEYDIPVRMRTITSDVLSDVLLKEVTVSNICDHLHFPDFELVKIEFDESCPIGTSDPENHWNQGTHHGTSQLFDTCFP